MSDKIKYICSTIFGETDEIYRLLFEYQEKYPHFFRDDVTFYAIRGTFNNLPWIAPDFYYSLQWYRDLYESESVKISLGQTPSMKTITESLEFFNNKGIQVQLDLNNVLLEEEDVFDRYGNFILRTFQELGDMNTVVISSPILENYIADTYPDIPIIKDISSDKELLDFVKLERIYDGGSLNKRYKVNMDLLSQQSPSVLRKIDVVVNFDVSLEEEENQAVRMRNSAYSLFEDPYALDILDENNPPSTNDDETDIISTVERVKASEQLQEQCQSVGINQFRIESTGMDINILKENIMRFVKPEHQFDVFSDICFSYYKLPIEY